jgi:mono/diheme cytochrome c family protein
MRPFLSVWLSLSAGFSALAADPSAGFAGRIQPLLKTHCTECHGGANPKAKLDLSGPRTTEQLEAQNAVWFRALERVLSGEMPPKEEEPLPAAARDAFAQWVRGDLSAHLMERQRTEGRSQLRRLSRTEFANTVQDIFGVRPPVLRWMPPDGRVDGYDKVRAALPFSAAATEAQLKLAEGIVSQMFDARSSKETHWLFAKDSEQSKGHILELPDGWRVSFNSDTTSGPLGNAVSAEGRVTGSPSAKKPGMHRLRIHAYGYQTDQPLPVGIYAGHTGAYPQIISLLKVVEIPPGKPSVVETDVYLRSARDSDVGVTDGIRLVPLGLGVPVPKNSQASERGKGKPGLALRYVEVEEMEETLPGQKLLLEGLPEALVPLFRNKMPFKTGKASREDLLAFIRQALPRIGVRLFRRDLTPSEITERVDRFMAAVDAGAKLQDAYAEELIGLMTAPDFLTLAEKPGRLNDFELASRLSYFLWNSTPDEELLAEARKGALGRPEVLRAQTERLLRNSKADRFVNDFLDQWLGLWGIDNTTPDKDLYPEYDEVLKISSLQETRETFTRMLVENRSVREFVAPKGVLINGRLSKHYGIPGGAGFALTEVERPPGTPFGGLWTHASVLKVTANGTLTSPIKRGVWVAERLLGQKIPPPPPVEGIEPDIRGAKTFREQLDLHRKGTCAVCHAKFDPYGFALESFDVTGQFRTAYRVQDADFEKLPANLRNGKPRWKEGLPVDASGILGGGKTFANIEGLRKLLAADPVPLARGFVRHLLTYSTGEPAAPLDEPAVEAIVSAASRESYGVRSLVHALVQSEIFRSK